MMWPWAKLHELRDQISDLEGAVRQLHDWRQRHEALIGEQNRAIQGLRQKVKDHEQRIGTLEDVRLWHNLDVAEANSATNGRSQKRKGRQKDALTPTNGRKSS